MQPIPPITDWSDEDLLEEYVSSGPDRPEVTKEILRRGLELPGDPEAADVAMAEEGAVDPTSAAVRWPDRR